MKDFNIHEDGNKVLTESVLNGIDVSNVIASGNLNNNETYTANQDCLLFIYCKFGVIQLNGVEAMHNSNQQQISYIFLLKKGDVIKNLAASTTSYTAYGIKR